MDFKKEFKKILNLNAYLVYNALNIKKIESLSRLRIRNNFFDKKISARCNGRMTMRVGAFDRKLNVFLGDPVCTRLKMTKNQFPMGKMKHDFSRFLVLASANSIYKV